MGDLWRYARKGRPVKFKDSEELWSKAVEYFEWCKANSLEETKAFSANGEVIYGEVPKMRAMTQAGLCTFLNIGVSTWHDYKNNPLFSEVTKQVELIIYEQKFSGAAAGMLNPNIIARDLGLSDKQELDHTSGGEKLQSPVYSIVKD